MAEVDEPNGGGTADVDDQESDGWTEAESVIN